MHAVIAILAALVRRAATGEGAYLDVSVADGVLALMALHVDEYLATGDESRRRATTSSPAATPATTSTAARDGKWLAVARDRAALLRQPLPRARAASSGSTHQTDDAVQDEIRADLRAAFATPRPRRLGRRARRRPTPACAGADRPRGRRRPAVRGARRVRRRRRTRATATFRQVGPVLAGMAATGRARTRCATRPSPTPTQLLARRRAVADDEIAELRDAGGVA